MLDDRGEYSACLHDTPVRSARMRRTSGAGGPGGRANEYGLVDVRAGGWTVRRRLRYDAAGNLTKAELAGDLDCDGDLDDDDCTAYELGINDPGAYAATYRVR
jgi:hypothetical protein